MNIILLNKILKLLFTIFTIKVTDIKKDRYQNIENEWR